jgi:hypothetical protein
MVSVAQNVFNNQFAHNLKSVPGIDPNIVIGVGATQLRSVVSSKLINAVLVAYNKSLTQTFYISIALSALAIFGALPLQWLSVKGQQIQPVAAA